MTSLLANVLAAEEEKLLACVHCGLCLEACPTYVATGDENDGPRGRIYLMRAVEERRLSKESPAFHRHINRCLGCRACESACPAGVEYGVLLEAARNEIQQSQARLGFANWLLRFTLRHIWLKPGRLRAMMRLARFFRDSGIVGLILRTGMPLELSPRFDFALALLDASKPDPSSDNSPAGDNAFQLKMSTLLFEGCVTAGLFARINEAAARVLGANGIASHVPEGQACCGALHAHAGDLEGARQLARQNIDAFADESSGNPTPIVTTAGGCGAMLLSYPHLLANDSNYAERARNFSARVRDVGQQLESNGFRNGAEIGSTRTTYDSSCHLHHGQHAADASLQMLWAIPDLNFALLRDSDVCCGGAGVYNLLEAELSEQVLVAKLDCIQESGAKVLATGNPGCHMQIAAGAHLTGMDLRVFHPIELLDESYRRAGFYRPENGDADELEEFSDEQSLTGNHEPE